MKPTATLTYADTKVGIPTLIQSLIMIPFSLFFHYAYTYKPYVIDPSRPFEGAHGKIGGFRPSYQGGFFGIRAYLYALNPSETFAAIGFAFTLFTKSASKRAQGYVNDRAQGREPLRPAESNQGISLAPSREEYHQPGYANVPNPAIVEPAGAYGHGNGNTAYGNNGYVGSDYSPRGHSRSPSREQFLPPGGSPHRSPGLSATDREPESYGPLNERSRY